MHFVSIILFILYYVTSFQKSKHRLSIQTTLLQNMDRYFPSLRDYRKLKQAKQKNKLQLKQVNQTRANTNQDQIRTITEW